MDEKVRNAILKQIEKEPFGKKFGLKLKDVREGYANGNALHSRYGKHVRYGARRCDFFAD
jgi:hypothetical protein